MQADLNAHCRARDDFTIAVDHASGGTIDTDAFDAATVHPRKSKMAAEKDGRKNDQSPQHRELLGPAQIQQAVIDLGIGRQSKPTACAATIAQRNQKLSAIDDLIGHADRHARRSVAPNMNQGCDQVAGKAAEESGPTRALGHHGLETNTQAVDEVALLNPSIGMLDTDLSDIASARMGMPEPVQRRVELARTFEHPGKVIARPNRQNRQQRSAPDQPTSHFMHRAVSAYRHDHVTVAQTAPASQRLGFSRTGGRKHLGIRRELTNAINQRTAATTTAFARGGIDDEAELTHDSGKSMTRRKQYGQGILKLQAKKLTSCPRAISICHGPGFWARIRCMRKAGALTLDIKASLLGQGLATVVAGILLAAVFYARPGFIIFVIGAVVIFLLWAVCLQKLNRPRRRRVVVSQNGQQVVLFGKRKQKHSGKFKGKLIDTPLLVVFSMSDDEGSHRVWLFADNADGESFKRLREILALA